MIIIVEIFLTKKMMGFENIESVTIYLSPHGGWSLGLLACLCSFGVY